VSVNERARIMCGTLHYGRVSARYEKF
jgi:hypothetical protein